jgi:transcriptional regulator with XRE-family HTH domain
LLVSTIPLEARQEGTRMTVYRRADLGEFLRHRRERLQPRDVGLVAGERRRTPGLRRDEVAVLASMSSDYYERLEQARGPQPSEAMIGAIARALRLTLAERDHLHVLAGHPAPAPHISHGYADPGLMAVLDAVAADVPALISDDLNTVIAQNPLNVALLGPVSAGRGVEANFTWRWFMDPAYLTLYGPNDRLALGRAYVADLRATVAFREGDRPSLALLESLQDGSEEFRSIWALHEVEPRQTTHKVLLHPRVGLLDCQCDVVLSAASRQRLVLFRPTPGTGTADRFDMLRVLGTQEFDSEPA